MSNPERQSVSVALACGGTGGHLFPGLAIAEALRSRGCAVTLLISPKEVDQQAVKAAAGMEIVSLPAVGLTRGREWAFVRGCWASYRASRQQFQARPPRIALAMGGFTSAPPILAARRAGARTFLHESNTIPGRANRWLSPFVDRVFVGFPGAVARLRSKRASVTGTPVRAQFQPREPGACRAALGLDPARPVVLVMGGSQGAHGINQLVLQTLPRLAKSAPEWQWFHLSGPTDAEKVARAYAALGLAARVEPFFSGMEMALGAATAAISRAGASSLAELAAVKLPAVLVPYPAATDNHQFYNASAFSESGAARLLEQQGATPDVLAEMLAGLVRDEELREAMRNALQRWRAPRAAEEIAETMLDEVAASAGATAPERGCPSRSGPDHGETGKNLRCLPAGGAAAAETAALRRSSHDHGDTGKNLRRLPAGGAAAAETAALRRVGQFQKHAGGDASAPRGYA